MDDATPNRNQNVTFTIIVSNADNWSRAKTVELSFNKRYSNRWSASIGGAHIWLTDFPNGVQRTPSNPGVEDRTLWNFKVTGSYDAAYGIRISPVLRHQSGANFDRYLSSIGLTRKEIFITSAATFYYFGLPTSGSLKRRAALASAVALPMMFLSGVFFPTETLPQVMQTAVRFLPLTPLIEALRTLRMIHYAGWLARRWNDPAFPVNFPFFNTQRYWQDHILALREQAAALDEPPLELAA